MLYACWLRGPPAVTKPVTKRLQGGYETNRSNRRASTALASGDQRRITFLKKFCQWGCLCAIQASPTRSQHDQFPFAYPAGCGARCRLPLRWGRRQASAEGGSHPAARGRTGEGEQSHFQHTSALETTNTIMNRSTEGGHLPRGVPAEQMRCALPLHCLHAAFALPLHC